VDLPPVAYSVRGKHTLSRKVASRCRATSAVCGVLAVCLLTPAVSGAETRYPLTYKQARKHAKARADQEAAKNHKTAKLTSLIRQAKRRFYAQAEWRYTDPHGCSGCGYDPQTGRLYDTPTTVECDVDIIVTRSKRTGKIWARLDGKFCN
jgi:hypothetical protein